MQGDLDKTRKLLGDGGPFASLPGCLQDEVLQLGLRKTYDRGQEISAQDAMGQGLFAVLRGRVSVTCWVAEETEVLLYVAGPGTWFGEIETLYGPNTIVALAAHTDVEVLLVRRRECARLIAAEPSFYRAFCDLALSRYSIVLRGLAESIGLRATHRLRHRLADLVELRLRDQPSEDPVVLEISQGDLAALVGISRQTANRVLQQLAAEGLVTQSFRRLVIEDPEGLRTGHLQPNATPAKRT